MKTATVAERSRDVVLEQWRELLRLRREALKTSGIETIHDLRVASRRFRAALGLFEPWIPSKRAAELKKNIRGLTRALGGLRNIDEALLFFRQHTPSGSAGAYQLRYLLTLMRGGELTRLNESLASFDRRRLDRIVRTAAEGLEGHLLAEGRTSPLTSYFSDTCSALYQPIPGLLAVATSREQHESRHALRIAIKKWRYFLEIIEPVLACDCRPALDPLKEYQTILGRMNDVAEFAVLCGGLALSRHERSFIEATLRDEEELLLQKLTALIARKPLTYICPF